MPVPRTYVRYAHPEGPVGLAYLGSGERLATAGADGELRLWRGVEDDYPDSFPLGDTLTALAAAGERLAVGTDANAVALFALPGAKPDGVLTRYTAPVTHLSAAAGLVASAGCDMVARVSSLDGQRQMEFDAFAAPVLSVALNAAGSVLLTTCCDGKAAFWDARGGRALASHAVLAKSNDVSTAPSPARPSWSPDGRTAAVPVDKGVRLFGGERWAETGRLASDLIDRPVTACAFSPCGSFVAAATASGLLLEWPAGGGVARKIDQHEGRLKIDTIAWHSDGDSLAFVDNMGQLGVTSQVKASRKDAKPDDAKLGKSAGDKGDADGLMDLDDLENAIDDDDRDLLEAALDGERNTLDDPAPADDDDDDDDDENVISLRKIKAESGFADDAASDAAGKAAEQGTESARATPAPPAPRGPAFAEPQPAFQPGSTPDHLERRFLVWNSVGVVTAHDADSIEVEFHDSAVHHPLHLRNAFGHALAALSEQALLLAAPAQDDQPAKLQCLHFGSWDSNKEWYLDLPEGEEAEAAALGADWLAVATSGRLLRLLTLTGVQRHVVSLSGPAVCLAGWEDRLMIVQHAGTGLPGEQCLSAQVLSAVGRRPPRLAPAPVPVPLSPRARLAWAGFTDQGTPCVADSAGAIRLLTGDCGAGWTPLLAPPPGADHLFVVGVSELEQTVRGLLCRGSRFPAVLPRPALSLVPFRLPLAEPDTARGRLEEEAARARLLLAALARLEAAGFETAEARAEPLRARAAALTQLFALAARTDREHRALDVAAQMEEVATVEAVAGYASRQRRERLAERLVRLAQALAEAPEEEPEVEEWPPRRDEGVRRCRQEQGRDEVDRRPASAGTRDEPADLSDAELDEDVEEDGEGAAPAVPVLPSLKESAAARPASPTFLSPSPRNPFKCDAAKPAPPQQTKGSAVFDDMKRQPAPTKRIMPEVGKKGAAKKKPRVSKEAAGRLASSMKSVFAMKPAAEKGENEENVDDNGKGEVDNGKKSAQKAGSGLAKLSAFAFADK